MYILTISTSDSLDMERTYIDTPTVTEGPDRVFMRERPKRQRQKRYGKELVGSRDRGRWIEIGKEGWRESERKWRERKKLVGEQLNTHAIRHHFAIASNCFSFSSPSETWI